MLDLIVAFSTDPAACVDDNPGRLNLPVRLDPFANDICHPRYLKLKKNKKIFFPVTVPLSGTADNLGEFVAFSTPC
jgi:hypothetical protein